MLFSFAASIILLGAPATVQAATDACYNPDGTQTTLTTFQPCFPSAEFTHCCDDGQTCLKNGLCLAKNDTSLSTGLCTDSTWQDQACFPRCLTPRRLHGLSTVYRCSNNNWCCSDGKNATSCCQDEGVNTFKIVENAVVENGSAFLQGYSIAPIASIIAGGETPSATALQTVTFTTDISGSPVTITATTTSDPNNVPISGSSDSDAALTTGLGAGLGVGLPLLAVIGVLSFLLFRQKKRHREALDRMSGNDTYGHPLGTDFQTMPLGQYQFTPDGSANQFQDAMQHPAEADSIARRIEADSREKGAPPPELPGS